MKRFLLLFLSIFFFFTPKSVFAVTMSDPGSVPAEVQIGQPFTVSGELSGVESGEIYFLKCRIGPSSSSLTEGQTYNSVTGIWLSDNGAWVNMPTVEVLSSTATFSLQCKVKPGVEPGQKLIFLRACLKQADGSCDNSFQSALGVSFTVLLELIPTSTPIPTLITSPTPTPTQIPTPTLILTPTVIPTLTLVPTLTPTLIPTLIPTPTSVPKENLCGWFCRKGSFFQRFFLKFFFGIFRPK